MASISKEVAQSLFNTIVTRKAIKKATQAGLLVETECIEIGATIGARGSLTRYLAREFVDVTVDRPERPQIVSGVKRLELGLPCGLVTTYGREIPPQNIIFGRAILGISESKS